MIRFAICDDSKYMCDQVDNLLFTYSIQKNVEYSSKQYSNGNDLLKDITQFDMVFLDYQFEDYGPDGMTIAKEIRKINKDIAIVFLTSYTNIVYNAFEVSAFRFLIKPLDEEKLFSTIDSYRYELDAQQFLHIKSEGFEYYLKDNNISYIEGAGKHSIIHPIGDREPISCNETLSAIEERLSEKLFFRCHKSFVINFKHVTSFNHTNIILDNSDKITISRQKYNPFRQAYSEYIGNICC